MTKEEFFAEARLQEEAAAVEAELTVDEYAVYEGLLDGLSLDIIAMNLGQKMHYAKNRSARVFVKFNVKSRSQLMANIYGRRRPRGG